MKAAATPKSESEAEVQALGIDRPYVTTWDELADCLGVEERSLFGFRQRHAVRIKELGRALTRADGRHVVAAWLDLAEEMGLQGRGLNSPDPGAVDVRQVRLRRELLQLKKAEFELDCAIDAMLPLAEFKACLAKTIGAFNVMLSQIPGRATSKIVARARAAVVVMLGEVLTEKQFDKIEAALDSAAIDYSDIEEVIASELDLARRVLLACEWFDAGEHGGAAAGPAPEPPPQPAPPQPPSPPRKRKRARRKR